MRILITKLHVRQLRPGITMMVFFMLLFNAQMAWSHAVQTAWCFAPGGEDIRIYIEHWHGPGQNVDCGAGATINVSVAINGGTPVYYYNLPFNSNIPGTLTSLPHDSRLPLQVISACYDANNYHDWGSWDFPIPDGLCPQGGTIDITVLGANDCVFDPGCGNLYPASTNTIITPSDCPCSAGLPGTDNDGDGWIDECDCDDNDASVNPDMTEVCGNGKDDDCEGTVDFIDDDGDGSNYCGGDDCDDTNATVYTGAPELCDGIDNDCDGVVPDTETDDDGDGYAECDGDCDDTNSNVNPGMTEVCGNGFDDDCDGTVDFIDNDGDGSNVCNGDDCDDNNSTIYAGAPELCDGIDNDCDGIVLATEIDDDGDGYAECDGDCDDADNSINPGAQEIIGNGIDDNCDGLVDILPYCSVSSTYACYYMYMTNVTFEQINNTTGCSTGYSQYNNQVAQIEAGNTYSISISGTGYDQYASVFVDWNLDGDFTDSGELIASYIYVPYYGSAGTASITIPSTATGNYTLRVITDYYFSYNPNSSCYSTYGEGEDYSITTNSNDPPVAICQDITLNADSNCEAFIVANDVDGGSSDPDGDPLTFSVDSVGPFGVGSHTVVLTVNDGEFSDNCNATVTVEDNTTPVISDCPANIYVCGEQSVSWMEPTASDNCLVSFTSTHSSGDVFSVGTTTVIYTATDEGTNTASCSFDIVVYELPDITIQQSAVANFCQGLAVLTVVVNNEAQLAAPLDYQWSNGLGTDAEVTIDENGSYSVTVTDANGCSSETSITVDEVHSDNLSAYILLGQKEVDLKESTVNDGGVGVIESGKKAKVKNNSHVYGFVKAPVIDTDNSSTIDTEIYDATDVTLPPFYENDANCSNATDVTVEKDSTETIAGETYDKIKIKKGGTLIIDSPEIYINDLDAEEDATIIFNQPTNVMVEKDVKLHKNNTVISNGHSVTFYIEKKADIKEGVDFDANIYAQEDIHVDGKNNNPSSMSGLYISLKKIHSHDNVHWYAGNNCAPATLPDGNGCNNGGSNAIAGNDLTHEATMTEFNENMSLGSQYSMVNYNGPTELNLYPNPVRNTLNLELNSASVQTGRLTIFNSTGQVVMTHDLSLTKGENDTELDTNTLNPGVYTLVLISADNQFSQKFIKVN